MAKKREREPEDLESIPGIGHSWAGDLRSLGIERTSQLGDKDPEALYDALRRRAGGKLDPCVLYAFRCAVHYAEKGRGDDELWKWWKWKDPRERPHL